MAQIILGGIGIIYCIYWVIKKIFKYIKTKQRDSFELRNPQLRVDREAKERAEEQRLMELEEIKIKDRQETKNFFRGFIKIVLGLFFIIFMIWLMFAYPIYTIMVAVVVISIILVLTFLK